MTGRSSVLFLVPLSAYDNISVEAWLAVAQWDLQDDAGTMRAVRYGVGEDNSEYQQALTNLKSRITTATSSDSFADERIASVSGLTQHYHDVGAYGDITPEDDDRSTFAPAMPLPVQVCKDGTSVGNTTETALIRDCSVLLDLKGTLAGTASLDWSKDTAIADWTGITVGGTPKRVTALALASSSLDGIIPAGLERLHGLTSLNLSNNQLTGAIPASLGALSDLSTLRLSSNAFSGCIPPALRDVTTNDLANVGLSYCDMLTPPPSPSGVNLALTNGVFTINWDAVSGADNYEADHRITSANGAWTALPETTSTNTTHTPAGGLTCGTTYGFRVRSYGDGIMRSADWGAPSDEVTYATEACN